MKPPWVAAAEKANAERRARAKRDAERLGNGDADFDIESHELENGARLTMHEYLRRRIGNRLRGNMNTGRSMGRAWAKRDKQSTERQARDKKRIES